MVRERFRSNIAWVGSTREVKKYERKNGCDGSSSLGEWRDEWPDGWEVHDVTGKHDAEEDDLRRSTVSLVTFGSDQRSKSGGFQSS